MNQTSAIQDILRNAEISCYASSSTGFGDKWCKLIFDGLMCWPSTPPGAVINQSCSNEYIRATKNGYATKQCEENGKWFIPEGAEEPYTDYKSCGDIFIKKIVVNESINFNIYSEWIPIIKNITQLGYVLSTISLIIALFVFIHIKRLHCARNKLHIHLFLSFVIRALMSLLKDGLFVRGTALAHDTVYVNGQPQFMKDNYSWICKAMTSSRNYFIMTNYMFVLMEGAYLHNLLFLKLFSENGVSVYCAFGWILPILFIIPWIILKTKAEDTYCWTLKSNKHIDLLIQLPIALSVVINFILFIIIMRVLFVKLTSMYIQQKKIKYQKLLRATLILVPLFGVPYTISMILSFYAVKNQTFEMFWLFFDQAFIAFQGLFASLVYCLLNNDVQVEIVRKYNSFKDRNNREFKKRTRTISHTTQIPLNEDMQELQNFGNGDRLVVNKTSDFF